MSELKKYVVNTFCKVDPKNSWAHCREKTINFVIDKCREYGEHFEMCPVEVFKRMEGRRNYSYPNYYQEANFPKLKDVHIFDNIEHFKKYVGKDGFRCPACKGVSTNPYKCNSGVKDKSGKPCDWKSYGLFSAEYQATFKDLFLKDFTINSIFTPIVEEGEHDE
jgi:hypothetical protein